MIHLVTFADQSMDRSRDLCIASFKQHSSSLLVHYSSPELLRDSQFYQAYSTILNNPRGCGFWAWKPHIIDCLLNQRNVDESFYLRSGDVLVYADAGIEFIGDVHHIIDRMDQDIFLFGNQWQHAHWCKRDVVERVWPYRLDGWWGDWEECKAWARFGKQVQASVIFFKVTNYTKTFVAEWLKWCLFDGGRLIDDSPSRSRNHPEFQEHRHDQAILTTMAYRDGLKLHWWPAQYNDGAFVYERGDYPDEGYPVMFNHHRRRNHEWSAVA